MERGSYYCGGGGEGADKWWGGDGHGIKNNLVLRGTNWLVGTYSEISLQLIKYKNSKLTKEINLITRRH